MTTLAKHSKIKLEALGPFDLQLAKIRMRRVQQYIPFSTNRCRRHMQRDGRACTNPTIAKGPQRFIPQLMPFAGKGTQIETVNGELVGKVRFNRNQVIGPQIWFEMNKSFDRSQSQRGRSVNHRHSLTIPAAAIEPRAFAREGAGGVERAANSPQAHQL